MSWLHYLFEANLYLILFFAFYYFVLRRETWYQYNRAYLLATSALAFIIPFVQLGVLKPTPVVPAGQLHITQIAFDMVNAASPVIASPSWTKEDYYLTSYLLIACCLLINLVVKIYKLVSLSRLNVYKKTGKWKLVETDDNKGAFSFFNYLFVSPEMALSETVIAHELVHIRQKHSWDIVYFEMIKVVSWFNPIAYLLQHSIKELHEFIADGEIAGDENKIDQYTDFLLGNAYGIHESQLTNNLFNKSLLKKRIMMLHQKRSGSSARLKYLLVLPLSAVLLCASTLAFAKSYGWIDIAPKHVPSEKTLTPGVVDATKVKRLKVTQGNISVITDKISVRESKSKTGIYTVATLTTADQKRLLKNYNIKVEVVETYSPAKPEEMKFPITVRPDAKKMPPPPPAEVIVNDKNNGTVKTKTGQAHTVLYEPLSTSGDRVTPLIIVNGVKYDLPAKLKPGEYLYTHATDSTIQYKPGNTFAIQKWGEEAKNGVLELYGQTSIKVIPGAKDTLKTVIKEKVDKEISTKTNSIIKKEITEGTSFKLPWCSPGFNNLFIYLGKNIHYPAKEYEQKIVGNVVVELTVNDNYKITNVKVMNDARPTFADEVVRATKRYADTINRGPGTYVLGVQFNLVTEKMTKTWLPKGLVNDIDDKPNYAGVIETVAYIKE